MFEKEYNFRGVTFKIYQIDKSSVNSRYHVEIDASAVDWWHVDYSRYVFDIRDYMNENASFNNYTSHFFASGGSGGSSVHLLVNKHARLSEIEVKFMLRVAENAIERLHQLGYV